MPNDKTGFNESFYQETYEQDDHITTHLPDQQELQNLIDNQFRGTGKDVEPILRIFSVLFGNYQDVKLLDFGASWGYMTYAFGRAGMDVQGYEISKKRADFGRSNLRIDLQSDKQLLRGDNEVFFSSHVIEHVPSIAAMIRDAFQFTREASRAYFFALCPNGSEPRRIKDPAGYHANWGLVHPNFISAAFYQHVFAGYPYYIGSNPYSYSSIQSWNKTDQVISQLEGDELMIIVRLK